MSSGSYVVHVCLHIMCVCVCVCGGGGGICVLTVYT